MSSNPPSSLANGGTPASKGKLYAIADLHIAFPENRSAWAKLQPHPNDGLILCGDICETCENLHFAFSKAARQFKTVWWCPGNHELYSVPTKPGETNADARGEDKYQQIVDICREYDILTPEDEFEVWDGEGGKVVVCPVFTLYDYSFRPEGVSLEGAVKWAQETDVEATDEHLLHPDPYASRQQWCKALVEKFEKKLSATNKKYPDLPLVVANHWPLREDLVTLDNIPRFSLWCGTKLTNDWHTRFNIKVAISGHLHLRRTDWRDGSRFEEVSMGYPLHWKACKEDGKGVNEILREIMPGPEAPEGEVPTQWRARG